MLKTSPALHMACRRAHILGAFLVLFSHVGFSAVWAVPLGERDFSLSSAQTQSAQMRPRSLTLRDVKEQAEARIADLGDAEASSRLALFHRQVEADAVETTWKLCQGYRRLRSVFGPLLLARDSMYSTSTHLPTVYGLDQSASAWAGVFRHGLFVTFSNEFGLKNDLDRFSGVTLSWMERWFSSLYVLYLLDSDPFLGAAMNCLETMDQREINRFASAILFADSVGAVVGTAGTFVASGEALALLARLVVRFAPLLVNPSHYLVTSAMARLRMVDWRFVRTATALIVIPVLADDLMAKLEEEDKAGDFVEALLHESGETRQARERRARLVWLADGHRLLRDVLRARDSGRPDAKAEEALEQFVHFRFSGETLAVLAADLETLNAREEQNLSGEDRRYLHLLKLFIPIARANRT